MLGTRGWRDRELRFDGREALTLRLLSVSIPRQRVPLIRNPALQQATA